MHKKAASLSITAPKCESVLVGGSEFKVRKRALCGARSVAWRSGNRGSLSRLLCILQFGDPVFSRTLYSLCITYKGKCFTARREVPCVCAKLLKPSSKKNMTYITLGL